MITAALASDAASTGGSDSSWWDVVDRPPNSPGVAPECCGLQSFHITQGCGGFTPTSWLHIAFNEQQTVGNTAATSECGYSGSISVIGEPVNFCVIGSNLNRLFGRTKSFGSFARIDCETKAGKVLSLWRVVDASSGTGYVGQEAARPAVARRMLSADDIAIFDKALFASMSVVHEGELG